MSESENDSDAARLFDGSKVPDPHGQAAMLLVESLIHGLIERSVITVADAVSFIDAATDVREEIAHDNRELPETMALSLTILRSMASSLRFDLGDSPLRPVD